MNYFKKTLGISANITLLEQVYRYNPYTPGDFIGYSQSKLYSLFHYFGLFGLIAILVNRFILHEYVKPVWVVMFSVWAIESLFVFISDAAMIRKFKKKSKSDQRKVFESGYIILGNKTYTLEILN